MFHIYHQRGGSRFFSGDAFWKRRRRSHAASTLLNELVAHWKLDEASGTRYDSAQSNHLTAHGNPLQVEGKVGPYATQFSPTMSDYLSTNSTAALRLNNTDFTIAGWIFLDSVTAMAVLGKWASGSKEYVLGCDGNSLTFSVSADGTNSSAVTGSIGLETGTWYHFAAWLDTAEETLNLSIDDSTPASVGHAGGVFGANSDFEMGLDNLGEIYFAGRLNAVSIWKRLLSADERTRLYNGGDGLAYPF